MQVGDVLVEINKINVEEQRAPALHYVRQGGAQTVILSRSSAPEGGAQVEGTSLANAADGGQMTAIAGSELPESVSELSAMLGTAKAKDTVTVAGLKDTDKTLEDGSFPATSTLVFFNCENCNFVVETYSVKIFIQSCKNCTVTMNGK